MGGANQEESQKCAGKHDESAGSLERANLSRGGSQPALDSYVCTIDGAFCCPLGASGEPRVGLSKPRPEPARERRSSRAGRAPIRASRGPECVATGSLAEVWQSSDFRAQVEGLWELTAWRPRASCGSMRTRGVKGGVFERILAMLLSRQVFVCSRCGWRGRGRRPAGVMKSTQRHARGSRVPDSLADTRTDAQIDLTFARTGNGNRRDTKTEDVEKVDNLRRSKIMTNRSKFLRLGSALGDVWPRDWVRLPTLPSASKPCGPPVFHSARLSAELY